jgi:hypothetical protein
VGSPFATGFTPYPLVRQTFLPLAATISGGGFLWHTPGLNLVWPFINELNPVRNTQVQISLGLAPAASFPTLGAVQLLASQQVSFATVASSGMWVDAFWDPITVIPGATYVLSIQAIDAPFVAGPGFTHNVYAGGRAYVNGESMDWQGFPITTAPNYDLTFRTFTSVPEPSTYTLMAVGVFAIFVVARRRRTT